MTSSTTTASRPGGARRAAPGPLRAVQVAAVLAVVVLAWQFVTAGELLPRGGPVELHAAGAIALVLALLGGFGIAAWAGASTTTPPPGTVRELALPPVADSETSGLAGLTARPWGTQIPLSCLYRGEPRPTPPPDAPRTTYVLVVRGADGTEQEIARWSPPPGQDAVVSASTDLPPDRVRGLEVRTAAGEPVTRS